MVTLAPIEDDNDGDNAGMDAVHPAIAGVITSEQLPPSMRRKPVLWRPYYAGTLETWVIATVAKECETTDAIVRRCMSIAFSERPQARAFIDHLRRKRDWCDDGFAAGFVAMVRDTVKFEAGMFD